MVGSVAIATKESCHESEVVCGKPAVRSRRDRAPRAVRTRRSGRVGKCHARPGDRPRARPVAWRSEEHTSELQSRGHLVCRLLLEKKKQPVLNDNHDT